MDVSPIVDACQSDGSGAVAAVPRLEDALAELTDFAHAVTISTEAAALTVLLRAVGVRPGQVVGVPAIAPPATGLAVRALGARPLFLDVASHRSFGLATEEIDGALDAGVRAVVSTPRWGYWDEDTEALARARSRGVPVVVDVAEAAFLRTDPPLAHLADGVCLSLHRRGQLSAGEGGVCLTSDLAVARRVATLSGAGRAWTERGRHVEVVDAPGDELGINLRINGLGAAWCLMQARDAESIRRQHEQDRLMADFCFRRPRVPFDECLTADTVVRHGYTGFAVVCADRTARATLAARLVEAGIELDAGDVVGGEHGPVPDHRGRAFTDPSRPCPRAEALAGRVVAARHQCVRRAVKRGLVA